MNSISNNMSSFLHTYEAYRVPKGTKVQNQAGEEVVLSNEEDTLVLTEKPSAIFPMFVWLKWLQKRLRKRLLKE